MKQQSKRYCHNRKTTLKADSIVNGAIEAHGGKLYDNADYSFVFRGTKYRFQNNEATYAYSSEIQGDSLIKDVMTPINLKGASTEFTIFRQRKD
jgi:hypothetical protein